MVFRQSANGATWEVRSADSRQDVIGMIGLRADGAYEVVSFERQTGFRTDALDSLGEAQAVFMK